MPPGDLGECALLHPYRPHTLLGQLGPLTLGLGDPGAREGTSHEARAEHLAAAITAAAVGRIDAARSPAGAVPDLAGFR